MTIDLVKNTTAPRLVCHFCGEARPPYDTVMRGHFRLCRECLLKHQIDLVVLGNTEIDEPAAME